MKTSRESQFPRCSDPIPKQKSRKARIATAIPEALSLYLPRRVMRDIHRGVAAGSSQRRHRYAGKWLAPSDPFVLASAASDDVGATVHLRLRLVRIASVKGRENLVTVAVGQDAGAVNVFLVT